MSIGKRLLHLRQQKHCSQEEVANQLNVSRQTVSKWESDLSLPDMKMMLDISTFYNISITELLGIAEDDTNDSIEHIYEQTNLVLANIQNDNKKRRDRDVIIMIVILITCFVFVGLSTVLMLKISKLENTRPNQTIIRYPTVESEKIVYSFEGLDIDDKVEVDLDNKQVNVNYQCILNKYDEDTSVQLLLIDTNKKEYQYAMNKENEYSFRYNGAIPLVDYESVKLFINFKDKTTKIEGLDGAPGAYLSQTIKNMFHLEMPKTKSGHLIENKLTFYTDLSRFGENEYIKYTGILKGNVHIEILKDRRQNGDSEIKEIQSLDVPFDKKTIINLKEIFKSGEVLYYKISMTINGYKIEIDDAKMLLETTSHTNPYVLFDGVF